jgi:hypothetical protein
MSLKEIFHVKSFVSMSKFYLNPWRIINIFRCDFKILIDTGKRIRWTKLINRTRDVLQVKNFKGYNINYLNTRWSSGKITLKVTTLITCTRDDLQVKNVKGYNINYLHMRWSSGKKTLKVTTLITWTRDDLLVQIV